MRGPDACSASDTRTAAPESAGALGTAVARILEAAEALRCALPVAVPVAFWDFDGTLLEGDCIDGYRRPDGAGYAGLVERAILSGLCPAYAGREGAVRCEHDFRGLLQTEGKPAAYGFQTRIFAGQRADPLRALAQAAFEAELGGWLFAESLAAWRALERAGVRCWVLSASPEFFVQAAASHLDVPQERCVGMRLCSGPDGVLGAELAGPVTVGTGKTARLHELMASMVAQEPDRSFFPIAAFGNDRTSDGPMIETVRRTVLPSGRAVGVFVNVPERPAGEDAPLTALLTPRSSPGC